MLVRCYYMKKPQKDAKSDKAAALSTMNNRTIDVIWGIKTSGLSKKSADYGYITLVSRKVSRCAIESIKTFLVEELFIGE